MHLVKKADYSKKAARTGAVTLIQRFGSALNLNIHFHMLFLDGVYVDRLDGSARFRWVSSPTIQELTQLSPDESDDILSARAYWSGMLRTVTCSLTSMAENGHE